MVADASRWDGIHGIIAHGIDHLDVGALLTQYRRLRTIGHHFRPGEHDLRVRADIAVLYMAFSCLQHLRHRLHLLGHPMSPEAIRRELGCLLISVLHRTGSDETYAMPSRATADARRIYRCLGITWNEAPFPLERKGSGPPPA